jgi:malonyl CoA-acyl carrier protein transacylase
MKEAREEFATFLDGFEFREPRIPVISNVHAERYTKATAKDLLAQQITSPVNWTAVVRAVLDRGEAEFAEIGPGHVLTDLIKQIRKVAKS